MKCMRQQPGSWQNMDMNSMKFPIMPEKAGNAGIMWGIGPGRIIWDLGLGAASLYGNHRFANTVDWNRYLENSSDPEQIREKEPVLTTEDEMAEFMFLGLRMTRGIARTDFARTFGCPVEKIYGEVLDRYMAMGMLQEKEDRIFLTRPGIHVSNQIMAEFLL